MTLMNMIEQGMVWQLVGMGILFIVMGIMISAIGGGKAAEQKSVNPDSSTAQKAVDMSAVTAAISAAINEYRKNN